MVDHRWDALRRKYLSLGLGELCAAVVFAVVGVAAITPVLTGPGARVALWSGLVPLLVVMVQGGAYWLVARRSIGRSVMPTGIARTYRVFRIVDPVLIGAGAIGLLVNWPAETPVALLVIVVWAFAVLEYINYFVIRLSYPTHQWFAQVTRARPSRISRDLRAARS